MRLIAILIAVAAVAAVLLLRPNERVIEVTHTALEQALADELKTSGKVGFLPSIRFSDLRWAFDDGMVIEGTGNWLSAGAGSYVKPDIIVRARVPIDPSDWTLSKDGLSVERVDLLEANRAPVGAEPARAESDPNQRFLAEALATLVSRLTAFQIDPAIDPDAKITAIQQATDRLIFTLQD